MDGHGSHVYQLGDSFIHADSQDGKDGVAWKGTLLPIIGPSSVPMKGFFYGKDGW